MHCLQPEIHAERSAAVAPLVAKAIETLPIEGFSLSYLAAHRD